MGYQFAHMELHSRKGGKSGSVAYVLDEAQRLDGACPHVDDPRPPEVVWGASVDELRERHDAAAETCRVTLENGRQRRIRKDQNTLASIVLSYPAVLADADPAHVKDWERHAVAWLQAEYGDQLVTVVRHVDEKHPHLHAYALPAGPEMRAASLHPGYQAKAAALAQGEDNKGGDRAYKAAMRQWQDRYWEQVGLPCGLARIGPGRRRLSRQQWHAEQQAAVSVLTARKATSSVKRDAARHIEKTKTRAIEIAAAAQAEAAEVAAQAAARDVQSRRTWYEVRAERKRVQRASRALHEREEGLRSIGGRIGALWTGIRFWLTSYDARLTSPFEEQVRTAKEEAREARAERAEERRKSAVLKDSVRDMSHDLSSARVELRRIKGETPDLPTDPTVTPKP